MPIEIKEKGYTCSDAQHAEIHQALIQEFEAVSKKENEKKIKLYNGILQQDIAEKYLYKFDVPNEPEKSIEPDRPYILHIDNKTIDGNIYSITGSYVEIELKEHRGQIIPSIDIIFDLKVLLDLIDRRIVLIDREPDKFKIDSAKFLFHPERSVSFTTPHLNLDHKNRGDKNNLNAEQVEAIQSSLRNKLTIIWGPPGTGKTITLQGVIAEFLANNKKLLFASNTNNAIDGLLKGLINKEKTPYEIFNQLRDEGKIIRIGSQTNVSIQEVFSPKAVLKQKSEKIILELEELGKCLEKERNTLKRLENELESYNRAIELKDRIISLKNELNQIQPSNDLHSHIKALENNKDSLLQEFLKYDYLLFSNTDNLTEIANKLTIVKEEVFGINVRVNKLKRDHSVIKQTINDLNREANILSNGFLKKLLNREKLTKTAKLLNEEHQKQSELESELISYEPQQKELIDREAHTTGQFISVFNHLFNRINNLSLNYELIDNLIRFFNLSINQAEESSPLWLQHGCELGLCTESEAKKILFIKNLYSINEEKIVERSQLLKNELEFQIRKNEKLKAEYVKNIDNFEEEFRQIRHLLDKPTEYWNSLRQEIESINNNKIHPLEGRIELLKAKLQELEKTLIVEAQLVCCTLVKASYDETLVNCKFDILVVDEVSMASLPQLYCAAALVSDYIVLCGDHLQLLPISISQGKYAIRWLKNSYFDFMEDNSEDYRRYKKLSKLEPYLSKLSEQFRMPKQISDLVKPWYEKAGNKLHDGEPPEPTSLNLNGHFLNEGTVFFLDTSTLRSYHSRAEDGSPYNLINAAIVAELARELIEDFQIDQRQIFCITPYRAQYQLTWELLKHFAKNPKTIRKEIASSVHKIQGDEAPIVIYDLTDGRQKTFTGFIKTPEPNIHNVAITRSKTKLIFVGDIDKLKKLTKEDTYTNKPSLIDVLELILKIAKIIDATPYKDKIFLNYTIHDFVNQGTVRLTAEQRNSIVVLTSNSYYKFLKNDIQNAKYSIFLVSPFITRNRWEKIKNIFLYLLEKNLQVKIKIITRSPDYMFGKNQINMAAVEILNEFIERGFEVKISKKIHSKLVVIDQGTENAISYWGSLNPLSFNNTDEINTRFEGKDIAEKLITLSMVGNLKTYKSIPLKRNQILTHIKDAVKKQLEDLRWTLAGYYHRPVGAICSNATLERIIKLTPIKKEEYYEIEEFKRANFVLWNHLDEINEIISPLRSVKPPETSTEEGDLFEYTE